MTFCRDCGRDTEHEREATLPDEYKCGDPDYEDRSKCGECGETYQCDDCGALYYEYHYPERRAHEQGPAK